MLSCERVIILYASVYEQMVIQKLTLEAAVWEVVYRIHLFPAASTCAWHPCP